MEECLRFDAPLHMCTRYALFDFEFKGIRLRKSDVVGLMLGAAGPDRIASGIQRTVSAPPEATAG
ncbi:MAG: cytochrome P450 [Candidatus Devosia symbiotica]|nr:cytochrome P450 [Candidatus Devosia symbiotica]